MSSLVSTEGGGENAPSTDAHTLTVVVTGIKKNFSDSLKEDKEKKDEVAPILLQGEIPRHFKSLLCLTREGGDTAWDNLIRKLSVCVSLGNCITFELIQTMVIQKMVDCFRLLILNSLFSLLTVHILWCLDVSAPETATVNIRLA